MANRQDIIDNTITHLHGYESDFGEKAGDYVNSKGEIESTGNFHVTYETAVRLNPNAYKNMDKKDFLEEQRTDIKKEKKLVTLMIEDVMDKSKLDYSNLTLGQSIAFVSMNYNSGLAINKTTRDAFAFLSDAQSRNAADVEEYKAAARGLIDITKASGVLSPGILNRTNSTRNTFDGNVVFDAARKSEEYKFANQSNKQEARAIIVNDSSDARVWLDSEMNYSKVNRKKQVAQEITKSGQIVDVNEITGEVTPGIVPTIKPEIPQGVN